jgi:hypothetical protein
MLLMPFKPSNASGSGSGSESSLLTPCRWTFGSALGIVIALLEIAEVSCTEGFDVISVGVTDAGVIKVSNG